MAPTAAPLPLTSSPGDDRLEDKLALCLSGGGYRAMLFHAGVLWYLNDAAYLKRLDRISSVSGGSLTAGVLGMRWSQLTFNAAGVATNFPELVISLVRKIAGTTIDQGSVLGGLLTPGTSIGQKIIKKYREVAFGDATLQNLPDHPRFVINAANVQTGALFRFSKPYIADWKIGQILNPTTSLAAAVAASSAFPPVLSPSTLKFKHSDWSNLAKEAGKEPFTTDVILSDGGVYDNIGIETAWKRCKRVLVSDAGAKFKEESSQHHDWARHSLRINSVIDNQVRSLRRRQVISAFNSADDPHQGAFWAMWTPISKYNVQSALNVDDERGLALAQISTRLAEIKPDVQSRVINYGYAMAERAIRAWFDPSAFQPKAFPAAGGV
ncbi:MAG TPA: patatin-like phospholipase family protein [Thermoanaerobaculia bacterium]|jgi:NTE family protein